MVLFNNKSTTGLFEVWRERYFLGSLGCDCSQRSSNSAFDIREKPITPSFLAQFLKNFKVTILFEKRKRKIFFTNKMKFSIQEEGKEKKVFLTFKEAENATGIPSSLIWKVLKRKNPKFVRKSDKKVFFIKEEKDEKLCLIDNEEFTSFQQIKERFGISPTKFLNQIAKKQKHFLHCHEISHFVKDLSPKMERLCDLQKHSDMNLKVEKKSSSIRFKRKVTFVE